MPKGDKSKYTAKQKRQAAHIESSAKQRGRSEKTAARIAWATVNKQDHGGKRSGSGRKKPPSRQVETRQQTKTRRASPPKGTSTRPAPAQSNRRKRRATHEQPTVKRRSQQTRNQARNREQTDSIANDDLTMPSMEEPGSQAPVVQI